MKKILILLGLCLITGRGFAQKIENSALNIGDQIPDIILRKLVNSPQKTVQLSDYKGKLIILDFWFAHCGACISGMPHLQMIQEKYKDKLKIFFIDDQPDNEDAILKVFKDVAKKTGVKMTIPSTLFDPAINKLFPHTMDPYEVWIDQSGKILAFTDPVEVTEAHIDSILKGDKVNFKMRNDMVDHNKLVGSSDLTNTSILYRSYFSKSITGVSRFHGPKYEDSTRKKLIGLSIVNRPLSDMFSVAYRDEFNHANGRLVYATKDSLLFKNVNLQTDLDKLFCYDLYVPNGCTIDIANATLREDLSRAFKYTIQNEKKIYRCLIIRTNDNINKSISKGNEREENLNQFELAVKNQTPVFYHNGALANAFTHFLCKIFRASDYFVETDFKQNIDLDFPVGFDFNNVKLIKSFLNDKGIDLSWENRELDVVVISDKKEFTAKP